MRKRQIFRRHMRREHTSDKILRQQNLCGERSRWKRVRPDFDAFVEIKETGIRDRVRRHDIYHPLKSETLFRYRAFLLAVILLFSEKRV